MPELSPDAQAAIRKIEKLLALAGNNPNEAEAAAAAAKVQELLAQYNLDMASLGDAPTDKSRADDRLKGGLYKWQRKLWRSVAELNFCMYWSTVELDMTRKAAFKDQWGERKMGRRVFKHRVLGRKVNVISTQMMAEYLEQAIERLVRDRLGQDHTQFFTRWAASYREGVASRLQEKLYRRRQEMQDEEDKKTREAATRSRHLGAAPSSSTGLAAYTQSEHDANIDAVYGEGTSARWAADRHQAEEKSRIAREERAKWELAHPEEAAAQKAEQEAEWRAYRKKQARNDRRRTGSGHRERKNNRDDAGYYAGYEDGASIGLDPQMNEQRRARLS